MSESMLPRIRDAVLDFLFPPFCQTCGTEGDWLCDRCLSTRSRPEPIHCLYCGVPRAVDGICAACRPDAALRGVTACTALSGPLRQAIHRYKYQFREVLGDRLATLFETPLAAPGLDAILRDTDVLLPIPLHSSREAWRGFNQSLLLAAALRRRHPHLALGTGLRRTRPTAPQVALDRPARRANLADAFACADVGLRGKRVLLIDDVLTTGATLTAAAEALRPLGPRHVRGLVIAHGHLH
jgi:ComF family protein